MSDTSEMKNIGITNTDCIANAASEGLRDGATPSAEATPQLPHICIGDMTANTNIAGFYVLQSAVIKTTLSGKSYLSGTVSDKTGAMPIIFWDCTVCPAEEGGAVFLKGQVSEFKGSLQITLEIIRAAGPDEDLSYLVPVAPIDADAMYAEIQATVNSLTDSDYKAVCQEFLSRYARQFQTIPAAKSVHHGFLHGLLMHTGCMLKIAEDLAALYSQIIDRNLLLTGTLLHDIAKREEFTFSGLGLVSGYSAKGQLLGHLIMGSQEIAEVCKALNVPEEKSLLLQHMLLSHHGKPEYGAAVVPMCAESELLSLIDMIDSRMEIYRENLEQTSMGQFSNRIFALDGHRIYRHYDPEQQS